MALPTVRSPDGPPFGSLVSFLFGAAQRETLPGRALVDLVGECGVAEPTARSGLARLMRQGSLVSARRGRVADYSLRGPMLVSFRRARSSAAQGSARPVVAPWEGSFQALLYNVPEQHRAFRDRLRRTARLAGYAPPVARISAAELRMDILDARRAAAEAWELDAIARRQRHQADRLAEAVRESGVLGSDADTLRRYIDLALPVYQAFAHDPHLPAELLPTDWPGRQLSENLGRLGGRFGPPVRDHMFAAIDAAG